MHFCKRKRLCTPLLEAGHSRRVRTACRHPHPRALWAGVSVKHCEIKEELLILPLASSLLCHHVYKYLYFFRKNWCLYHNKRVTKK